MRETTGTWATGGVFMRIALLGMALALGACQTDKVAQAPEQEDVYDDRFRISSLVGTLQTAPDEFSVLTKRPLELPRDFTSLPVPEPGKRSTRDPDPQADARAALAFDPAPVPATTGLAPSATEAAILSSAGPVDPSIRTTLAAEQAQYDANQNLYLLDRVFPSLRRVRGDLDPDAIDAEAERLRLLEAGVTPRQATVVSPLPAAPAPAATVPTVVTPAPPAATIPAPAAPPVDTTPTFGVLSPESTTGAPELIYLPE